MRVFLYYLNLFFNNTKNHGKLIGAQVGVDEILMLTINDMTQKVFGNQWATAAHTQKGYLCKNLAMDNMEPDYF